MSVVRKLLGTIEDTFWIFQDSSSGLQGIHLDNITGTAVDVKDAGGTLVPVRVGAPVGADDAARLSDLPPGAGSEQSWIMIPVAFGNQGTGVASTATVPNNAIILDVRVNVTTQFENTGTPTAMPLTAELTGVGANFLDAADSDTTAAADYVVSTVHMNSSGGPLTVTVNCGAATLSAGAANVLISYSEPAT